MSTTDANGSRDKARLPRDERRAIGEVMGLGDGAGARWGLDTHHGWTLSLTDAPVSVGGAEGCVGAVG